MTAASAPVATPRSSKALRRHTVVVQLHDRPGALYRAIGLVRRRDYNVSSLVVGASERAGTSRMVLVVEAADVQQILSQLMRLVDVVSVAEISPEEALVRETVLAVVEVHADEPAVLSAANDAGARVSHRAHGRLLLELTAEPARVDEFVVTMRRFDLRQLARTGPIVIREREPVAPSAVDVPSTHATIGMASLTSTVPPDQELFR
jgi:acetolactate synthase-1/3 small subunit